MPSATGILALTTDLSGYITADSSTIFTNKSFNDFTTFNNSLETKSNVVTNSGAVRFYEASNNGTNVIDLHVEGRILATDINVYLPNSVNGTILVGKYTTDTLTNKTIQNFIGNSGATITAPSTTGTLALVGANE